MIHIFAFGVEVLSSSAASGLDLDGTSSIFFRDTDYPDTFPVNRPNIRCYILWVTGNVGK
jgi:hypothetical protein